MIIMPLVNGDNFHEVCLAETGGGVITWHAPCSFCSGVYGVW